MRSNFREGTAGCGRGGPGSATSEGDQRDRSPIDLGNSSQSRSGKWRIAEEAEKPRVKRRRAVRLGRFLEREIAFARIKASSADGGSSLANNVRSSPLPCEGCPVMAIALLGKCVALLGLVVLYATCYGFRIRDVVPQTHQQTACIPAHGRACPTDRTVTTGAPMYSARKWQESTVPRTAGGRKPPAESTSDVGTERIRIERIAEHPRDKSGPRSPRIESDEVGDDEAETAVEVESVEEDSVGDSERDQTDEKTDEEDEEEEKASEAELSDQDLEGKKRIKKKFYIDDDKSEDDDDDDDDEDEDEDEDDDKKTFKRDSEKQVKEIKITKIIKSMKYGKADDNDEEEKYDKSEEEKKATKIDQRKVTDSLKKQFKKQEKDDEDQVEDEDKKPDIKETTPAPRKLEKVRLADKDRTRTKILPSKPDMEKPKPEDKKSADVAKPVIESVKKTAESTKESVDSTKKSVESAKKLTEDTKKVESIKITSKPKSEAATKVDEKSKTQMKPETSTPAPKIKEQAKQPDVKKITAKPTSKPKEVLQAESEYYVKMVR